jgi:hypothetical protein
LIHSRKIASLEAWPGGQPPALSFARASGVNRDKLRRKIALLFAAGEPKGLTDPAFSGDQRDLELK